MSADHEAHYAAAAGWLHAPPRETDVAGWREDDCRAAQRAVLVHGIAPLLGARGTQAFAMAPAWFRDYLAGQFTLNGERIARLRGEADAILTAARAAQIDVVPLKGAALFSLGAVNLDERPMSDLDFLVRCEDALAFGRLLQRLDYALSEQTPRHEEYTCKRFSTEVVSREGEHPDNPIKAEVHTWVGQVILSSTRVLITDAMWEGRSSARALLLHFALHAGANAAKQRLRLVQLRDIEQLGSALSPEDWTWLSERTRSARAAALVYSALRLSERFARLKMPAAVHDELRRHVPHDLLEILHGMPLHSFTLLSGQQSAAWEIHWLDAGAQRAWVRLKRAVPFHRLAPNPAVLRERYGVPLGGSLARAYALHAARVAAWPVIVASRLLRGAP